jgi:hypothetical protein
MTHGAYNAIWSASQEVCMRPFFQALAKWVVIVLLLSFVGNYLSVTFQLPQWAFVILLYLGWGMFVMWQRGTTHFLRSVVAATVYTGVLWFFHSRAPLLTEATGWFNIAALRFKLFDSGPIPLAILWTFFAGLHRLWVIYRYQLSPLQQAQITDRNVLAAVQRRDFAALVAALQAQSAPGYYGQRLEQFTERWARDQDLAAAIALKNDLLEIDEEGAALAFVPITWCEVALPLWGFLGTVVGIGDAVVAVAQAVRILFADKVLSERVLGELHRGFQGMGLAYDTTFLGLAGVILVGIGHVALKRGWAAQLAQARAIFSNAISLFTADSAGPVVIALTGLEGRLQAVEMAVHTRLQTVEEALRLTELRATLFRETVRTLVERVLIEDPAYASIKQVLFRPVVAFQAVGKELADQTHDHVKTTFPDKTWAFSALGLPLAPKAVVHGGVVAIEVTTTNEAWLLPFDIAGPHTPALFPTQHHFTALSLLGDRSTALGRTAVGELVAVRMIPPSQTQEQVLVQLAKDEAVLPVLVQHHAGALILRRALQSPSFDVSWFGAGRTGALQDLGRLPGNFEWSVWAAHAPSATLVAAGKATAGPLWRLLLVPIRRRPVQGEESASTTRNLAFEFADPHHDQWLDLPAGLVPKRLIPLANDLLLILDTAGKLHYWDTTRPTPLPLSHMAWQDDPNCVIHAGAGGWLAVARFSPPGQERLSMWRVRRGGFLYPYGDEPSGQTFPIEFVEGDSLQVTADGRYLFAIARDMITTWEFPRYAVDAETL